MEEFVELKDKTTFKIGGKARYFFTVHNAGELKTAVNFAKEKKLPVFVLGGGSNILISDNGFPGVVINFQNKKWKIDGNNERFLVEANAGVIWDDLVEELARRDIVGLENLSLIPGTVGGAVVQNIGAYGIELQDFVEKVFVFDCGIGAERIFDAKDCDFSYRDSIFKKEKRLIVTGAVFNLPQNQKPNISYRELRAIFSGRDAVTSKEVREAVISIRKDKLPDYRHTKTAGSYFKNPIIPREKALDLQGKYPDLPIFLEGGGKMKIGAAYLIDRALNLKNFHLKAAYTYQKQALVICAEDNAQASDVLALANYIKKEAREKLGIIFEEEVIFIS